MIVIDVETLGHDPKKHALLSIGAVEFENPSNQFYGECRAWEGSEVYQGDGVYYGNSLEINGLTWEQATNPNRLPLKKVIKQFFEWVNACKSSKVMIALHPWFDMGYLKDAAKRAHLKYPLKMRTLDLHTLCFTRIIQLNSYSLLSNNPDLNTARIMNFVGLPEEPKPHHGLTGAKMEAEAFSRLLYGKNLLEEFKKYPLPKELLK